MGPGNLKKHIFGGAGGFRPAVFLHFSGSRTNISLIGDEYLQILEGLLHKAGSKNPRVESIILMAFVEGSTIFVASGKRWENDDSKMRSVVCDLVDKLYGGDA